MNNQSISVNPEDLKEAANAIRKNAIELKEAKKLANSAWEDCNVSLSENFLKMINENKRENDKKFDKAIEELNSRADSLDAIANIWKDSEIEIMASMKNFNEVFEAAYKLKDVFLGNNNVNKQ